MMIKQILFLACGVGFLVGGWEAWLYRRWPSGFVAGAIGVAIITLVLIN